MYLLFEERSGWNCVQEGKGACGRTRISYQTNEILLTSLFLWAVCILLNQRLCVLYFFFLPDSVCRFTQASANILYCIFLFCFLEEPSKCPLPVLGPMQIFSYPIDLQCWWQKEKRGIGNRRLAPLWNEWTLIMFIIHELDAVAAQSRFLFAPSRSPAMCQSCGHTVRLQTALPALCLSTSVKINYS